MGMGVMTMVGTAVYAALVLMLAAAGGDPQPRVQSPGSEPPGRWPEKKVWDWYKREPWLCGFNYVPSVAVNDTEMWQAETFDAATIDRELGWAQKIGCNSCRVFLQYIVWKSDPEGFRKRFDRFLEIADKHGIRVMPVLFDDCAFDSGRDPYLGKQDDPIAGVHNSRWVPSPGAKLVADRSAWPDLERYVKDLVGSHRKDHRIVVCDLYNEPSLCSARGECLALPLVEAAFRWARETKPSQPLTTCIFGPPKLAERIPELCDIISLHNYSNLDSVKSDIDASKRCARPIIVSEWMSRDTGSWFASHLPYFKEQKIGCFNWGLVAGRTQTYYPWGSPAGSPEPKVWHHDVLRKDGTPYDPGEIAIIRKCTGAPSEARDRNGS